MNTSTTFFSLLLAPALASFAAAAPSIVYVDENATGPTHDGTTWCTAFTTLYDGLAAAGSGDKIHVAGGVYTPDPSLLSDPRTATFSLKSGVGIEGGYGGCGAAFPNARDYVADKTFIRGDPLRDDDTTGDATNNSYHVLSASFVGSGAYVDGCDIDAGRADNSSIANGLIGGGVLSFDSSLTIVNCIIQGNIAIDEATELLGRGGGVYALRSDFHFVDCLIRECSAGELGGGVYSEDSSIVYEDSEFAGCMTNGKGGGTYLDYQSSVKVFDGEFNHCGAVVKGGGMFNDGAPALIARTFFDGCASGDGGCVYALAAKTDFVNCRFLYYNHATNDGGCIYGSGGTTTLMNCLLAGNYAGNAGGGIVHKDGRLSVANSTITANTASSGAAGIEISGTAGTGGAGVINTILWRNGTAGVANESAQIRCAVGSTLHLNYSDVNGLTGTLGGAGNVGGDPLFVAPSSDDYTLGTGSPCRNTGSNAAIPADIADLDGDANLAEATPLDLALATRVQSTTVDMGAYEAGP